MNREEQRRYRESLIDAMSIEGVTAVQLSMQTALEFTNSNVCNCGLARHIHEALEIAIELLVSDENDRTLIGKLSDSFNNTANASLN